MEAGELLDGRFVIESLAGSYASSRIYRAREVGGGPVAIKELEQTGGDLGDRLREIDAVARLRHPRIVRYLAHGLSKSNRIYLATEWIDGETLAQRLARSGLLPKTAVEVVARVAEAIAEAHRASVLHLDIKASNVMLEDGLPSRVKVLDFGLARLVSRVGSRSSTASARGTPGYVAPERVRGLLPDERADVFGLGCLLYECLVGRAPFRGGHPLSAHARVLAETAPLLRATHPELSGELEAFIDAMLDKDRERRPASAAEVARRLNAIRVLEHGEEARESISRTSLDDLAALSHEHRRFAVVIGDEVVSGEPPEAIAERAARRALDRGSPATLVPVMWPDAMPGVQSRGGIRLEGGLEALLGPTFEITRTRDGVFLRAEHAIGDAVPEHRCIGRERELAWLLGAADAAVEQQRARMIVVTGRAGIGKSRLLVELARRSPAVEILDGIDREDTSGLRAVFERVRERGFVVVAARPELAERMPTLFTEHGAERLGLSPLNHTSSEALARAAGAPDPDAVAREAEGNPRLILALSTATSIAAAPFLVAIEALPDPARRVLRAASLLDRTDETRVRALLPDLPKRELREWLDLLVDRGFLVADADRFVFARELLREAARASLTAADRELGQRLAEAIRELF